MSSLLDLELSDLNYRELQAKAKLLELPGNFKHDILVEVIKARQEGDEVRVQSIISLQKDERAKKRALKTRKYMMTRNSNIGFRQYKKLGRPKKNPALPKIESKYNLKKTENNNTLPISFNNVDSSSVDYLKTLLSAPKANSIEQLLKDSKVPNAKTKQPGSHFRQTYALRNQSLNQYKYDNRNYVDNTLPRNQVLLSGGGLIPPNNRPYDHGHQQNVISCGYNNPYETPNLPINNNSAITTMFQFPPVESEENAIIQNWPDNIPDLSSILPSGNLPVQSQSRFYVPVCQDLWKQEYQHPPLDYWPRQSVTYPASQSYSDEYIVPMTPSSDTMSGNEDTSCYQDNGVPYPNKLIPTSSYIDTYDSQVYRPTTGNDYPAIFSADNLVTQPDPQVSDQGLSTLRLVSVVDHQEWTYECHSSFTSQSFQSQPYDYQSSVLAPFPNQQYSSITTLI